ncbi:hypothetical protein [Xenorhabdus bovienii]|uniref:hypothetical protein n=1 Tax=Xenorhabdus bovienii TaxID=40576 RepID=UPI0023B2F88A|nr:hypothetical protein [Xenorhabdus bovienii]MDE9459689.1 hypothetical protein [Xenorhabdus bovienii]MDE9488037.1 hypothetical protein [Xenorhabdus bovienii]MDE9516008.1 hypothetical protein [Xenorhabdus bovienii]
MLESKGSIETFPFFYHARMLADGHRLKCFRTAINQTIRDNYQVVDLGGGTGVLTQILTQKTNGLITYIDISKASSVVAKKLNMNISKNIQYINKNSFDVQLETQPNVLVTETLGYFGIDEGIVESCYDFCIRHPSINKLIPNKVSLKYQFLHLPELNTEFELLLSSYTSQFGTISSELISEFEILFCNLIRTKFIKLDEVKICSEPELIKKFNLGIDNSSNIDYFIDCNEYQNANVIHFYFEAELNNNVKLSNYIFEPKTHWFHSYAGIPKGIKKGKLTFEPTERKLKLRWK